jgi:hypothetical protein
VRSLGCDGVQGTFLVAPLAPGAIERAEGLALADLGIAAGARWPG